MIATKINNANATLGQCPPLADSPGIEDSSDDERFGILTLKMIVSKHTLEQNTSETKKKFASNCRKLVQQAQANIESLVPVLKLLVELQSIIISHAG
jgi:hypothetical protein